MTNTEKLRQLIKNDTPYAIELDGRRAYIDPYEGIDPDEENVTFVFHPNGPFPLLNVISGDLAHAFEILTADPPACMFTPYDKIESEYGVNPETTAAWECEAHFCAAGGWLDYFDGLTLPLDSEFIRIVETDEMKYWTPASEVGR